MTTHKTFGGMADAVRRMIEALKASPITEEREYKAADKRVSALLAELNSLWSSPADSAEAAKLKNDLLDAWHDATNVAL